MYQLGREMLLHFPRSTMENLVGHLDTSPVKWKEKIGVMITFQKIRMNIEEGVEMISQAMLFLQRN